MYLVVRTFDLRRSQSPNAVNDFWERHLPGLMELKPKYALDSDFETVVAARILAESCVGPPRVVLTQGWYWAGGLA